MSDTPRTDENIVETDDRISLGRSQVVSARICRQLERELAEAQKDAARYKYLRRQNVPSFKLLYEDNIATGIPFDELVDRAIRLSK